MSMVRVLIAVKGFLDIHVCKLLKNIKSVDMKLHHRSCTNNFFGLKNKEKKKRKKTTKT